MSADVKRLSTAMRDVRAFVLDAALPNVHRRVGAQVPERRVRCRRLTCVALRPLQEPERSHTR